MTPGDATNWTGDPDSLRMLAGELAAVVRVVGALPRRSTAADTLDEAGSHPVPVVLVHGLLGDPTNFATLRRHLARHGIRRFSSFRYWPRLDYQRLAARFAAHVSDVCRETGATQVDVIGHSLGGLVARYFLQTGDARLVRCLVTLGTPYLGSTNPPQEVSIFAEHDPIVPPPVDGVRRRAHVDDACGHLGLLTDERALAVVARYVGRPTLVVERVGARAA